MYIGHSHSHGMIFCIFYRCNRTNRTFYLTYTDRCGNISPENIACRICLSVSNSLYKCRVAQYLNIRIFRISRNLLTCLSRHQHVIIGLFLKRVQLISCILAVRHCQTEIITCNLFIAYAFRTIDVCPASGALFTQYIQLASLRKIISHSVSFCIFFQPSPANIFHFFRFIINLRCLLFTVDNQIIIAVNFFIFHNCFCCSACINTGNSGA